jgi:hypothetical protein
MNAVDDECPFRVLLEKGALVLLFSGPFVLERCLVDIRRGLLTIIRLRTDSLIVTVRGK